MEWIDFHTHILPQIDDGSSSLDMSLQMLRTEAEQGVKTVVLTPHFYPWEHTPETFLEKRNQAYFMLQEAAAQDASLPELVLGAEVHFFRGMSHSDSIKSLAIGQTKHLMVEMPTSRWTSEMLSELEMMERNLGLTPIIAHLDRYLSPWTSTKLIKKLEQLPVLIQVNASFFESRWNTRMAKRLLSRGMIHLLGSDCHNTTTRPPCLPTAIKGIEQLMGEALDEISEIQESLFPQR